MKNLFLSSLMLAVYVLAALFTDGTSSLGELMSSPITMASATVSHVNVSSPLVVNMCRKDNTRHYRNVFVTRGWVYHFGTPKDNRHTIGTQRNNRWTNHASSARHGVVMDTCPYVYGRVGVMLYDKKDHLAGLMDVSLDYNVLITKSHINREHSSQAEFSGVYIQGVDPDVDVSTGFGRMMIEVSNNEFRMSLDRDPRYFEIGTALFIRNQLTPGSIVKIFGNYFQTNEDRIPRFHYQTGEFLYGAHHRGCAAIDVGVTSIPVNASVQILNNQIPNYKCEYEDWGRRYRDGSVSRQNAAIMVGTERQRVPVMHGAEVKINGNSVFIECRKKPRHCYAHNIYISTLQAEPGSKIHVHGNQLNGVVGNRIEARRFVFSPYDASKHKGLNPGVLSIKHNNFTTGPTASASLAFSLYPTATDFPTIRHRYPSGDTETFAEASFTDLNSEGGDVIFEDNTLSGFRMPIRVQFPAGTASNNPVNEALSLPHNLRISGNTFSSTNLWVPVSVMDTRPFKADDQVVVSDNTFKFNNFFKGVFLSLNNTIVETGRVHVYSNNRLAGGTGVFARLQGQTRIGSGGAFTFCNNTYSGLALENDANDFRVTGMGGIIPGYLSCFQCNCADVGGDTEFCDNQPGCCMISSTNVLKSDCPASANSREPFPTIRAGITN